MFYNRYFADFFVHECRRNPNAFASYADEARSVTENWAVVNTDGYYGAVYVF